MIILDIRRPAGLSDGDTCGSNDIFITVLSIVSLIYSLYWFVIATPRHGVGRLFTGKRLVLCTEQDCSHNIHHSVRHIRQSTRMADNVSSQVDA